MDKTLIYDLGYQEISKLLDSWGEPPYRADQLWNGIYQNLWTNYGEFTTIPKGLRTKLFHHFSFKHLEPVQTWNSTDGETQKVLFQLQDGNALETVRMCYEKRRTLCISTQSGCAMGCLFCATGQMGYHRNLSSGEIIEQVLFYARKLNSQGENVTNVVFMGMGEPFHNYEQVMKSIKILNHPKGMNLGARRFTVSTVGLIPAIRRFTKENLQVNLAVSLHAAEDQLRSSMLPINKKYPIRQLMTALKDYVIKTNRRVTIEWALIQNVNDSPDQAHKLGRLLRGILAHVNVIPLNPTREFNGQASSRDQANKFKAILDNYGIPCTIRIRRGIDIQAGCGQLAKKSGKQ